jgi:hypothetical protein
MSKPLSPRGWLCRSLSGSEGTSFHTRSNMNTRDAQTRMGTTNCMRERRRVQTPDELLLGRSPIGSFFFRCPVRRALPSGRASCFGASIDLPDITDPITPPAAASGGLSPSVYSTRDVMQPEIHAHVGC